ncbi:MAG: response regulator [Proteobacteria bacterium]|nr:response regulator [Pseudomonadota bacterium]
MTRVVVADDHDLVREGIIRMLNDEVDIEVVADVATGEEAIRACRDLVPDVVLMDLKMPGIGGLEATRRISEQLPDISIVIVTALDDDPFPVRLFGAGASGFVTKSSNIEEVITAIRRGVSGKRFISPAIASRMVINDLTSSKEQNPFKKLSERELQICLLIINGYRSKDIADTLHLSPQTVGSHRQRLFDKLHIKNDVDLTRLSIRYGLIDEDAV